MNLLSNSTAKTICAASVSCMAMLALPAQGASVDELEAKLTKAMALIEAQAKQMEQMSGELKQLKAGSVVSTDIEGMPSGLMEEINERLEEVENTVYEIDDKVGSRAVVNAFDALSLDIGGFIHTTYTSIESDNGSASAFDTQNFELLIRADLDDQWSAFFAGGFLREENDGIVLDASGQNPDFAIANKNPQIIGWVNYKHQDNLNVQIGRMITPHGIVNIEHFPQTLLDPRQPQFLRPFSGDTIFPNFVTGAQLHGKFFFKGDNQLQYNAYVAGAQSDPEAKLYGGRLAYTHGKSGVTFGVNALTGARDDQDTDSDYSVYGADLLIDKGPILLKSEIFGTSEDQAGLDDRFAWYIQPAWRINNKFTLFYRYDFLDDGNDANGGDTVENVLGLTYKPKPNVHVRLTGTLLDLDEGGTVTEDRDATVIQASTTVSF